VGIGVELDIDDADLVGGQPYAATPWLKMFSIANYTKQRGEIGDVTLARYG
jgi:hypothetical protein